MSRPSFITKKLGANALPVIANPQTQLTLIIVYIHLDASCLCMVEGIAQGLACNPINVVAEYRIEVTQCALHGNIEDRRILSCFFGRKFLTESLNSKRKVITHN